MVNPSHASRPQAIPRLDLQDDAVVGEGVEGLEVFYGPPIQATRRFAAGGLGRAESWLPAAIDLGSLSGGRWNRNLNHLRLDLGRRTGVTIRIRSLQLRPPNPEERRSQASWPSIVSG